MGGGKLVGAGPLHVIDDMAAVLAAVQVHRDETRLRRHKTCTLDHQFEDFVLVIGGKSHHVYLRANAVAFADLGHSCSPGCSAIGRGPEHASSVGGGHADGVTLSAYAGPASCRRLQPIVAAWSARSIGKESTNPATRPAISVP